MALFSKLYNVLTLSGSDTFANLEVSLHQPSTDETVNIFKLFDVTLSFVINIKFGVKTKQFDTLGIHICTVLTTHRSGSECYSTFHLSQSTQ